MLEKYNICCNTIWIFFLHRPVLQEDMNSGTGSSREKKMKKKHNTIELLCQRFDTIDKGHWDEWLVTVYSVLLGD
jgi:hypothetical protein